MACRESVIYTQHLEQWKNNFSIGPTPKMTEEECAERKTLKQENDALRRELRRKEKALAEVAALLILQKKSENLGARRGKLTMIALRDEKMQDIKEAQRSGARQSKACEISGISAKTFKRWCDESGGNDGRLDTGREPHNKLTELERQCIISTACKSEYAALSAAKLVPTLADKGIYIGSESTVYRVLKANGQLKHRQKSKPAKKNNKPMPFIARQPNQIYSWDITYLPTAVRGVFYYLYLVLDIYSRKIVGWQVYENESAALAADLMKDICLRENIGRNEVVLHSDNGSPMKGGTMLATLQELGVMPSFSRPSVSNDNPYSESMFRTLKYRPNYPEKPFIGLADARSWVNEFVEWYNHEHLHSSIQFVTPAERHAGNDVKILEKRRQVYLAARNENPHRWSGNIRNWNVVTEVYLNPDKQKTETVRNQVA
jgi:putative transposase